MKRIHSSLIAIAVSVMACTDAIPVTSDDGWLDPRALADVAYAVAGGLASSEARADILKAMRASPKVQHSLLLGEYLGSIAGDRLLRDGAFALGVSENEFYGKVLALPRLEIVVPVREHRLNWTGSARIGVAGSWDSDVREFTVYDQVGASRHAGGLRALMDYDAFFHIRPQENVGTRIDRQPDVPGAVIQDEDDGERAMILTIGMPGVQPRSVDYGQYTTELELQAALVEAFGSDDGQSVGDIAADGDCTGPSCDDDDRDEPGSGAVGGWGHASTYARHWSARCSLVGEGLGDSSEVEIRMRMNTGQSLQEGHFRLEGLECHEDAHWVGDDWSKPGRHLAAFSKIAGGNEILYIVIETDFLFDDELGRAAVEPENNKNHSGYDPELHPFVWWDYGEQLPHMIAEISW